MGTSSVAIYRRHPDWLRYPPLGDFGDGTFRTVLLRKLLLAWRVPVWPLGLIDRFLASRPPSKLYQLVQLHCFWRSARKALTSDEWNRLTRGTVILMYHALGRPGESANRFLLPARQFARQLRWLRRRRRPIISLDDYVRRSRENPLPPARAVVLTFDDGYADTAQLALPKLQEADAPAEVFLVTGMIGGTNGWDAGTSLRGRALIDWAQVAELRDAGVSIGAHTITHPRLPDLDRHAVTRELAQSRATLEEAVAVPVDHFAYPYGKTSPAVEQLAGDVGYVTACGIEPGFNGPAISHHNLRRVEVDGTWSLWQFALALWTGHPPRFWRNGR
jgi:peptidoglycan/xylan/chitin deacetylase (PgdA/CDA1 family)